MWSHSKSTLGIILQKCNKSEEDLTEKRCEGMRSKFEFEREERKGSNPAGVE